MTAARLRRSALLIVIANALPLWSVGNAVAGASMPAHYVTIYVVRRGWHIDVGFAASDLTGPLTMAGEQFPEARFVTFGFGDRRYLHAHNPAFPNMLAALWPGDGLMLITALRATPQQAFGTAQVVELRLTVEETIEMQGSMAVSLTLHEGRPELDGPGPYDGSAYWRSSLRYSAAYTCNTWAAQMLASAGLPLPVRGVVFAGQVWRPVLHLARAHQKGEPATSAQ